MRIAILASFLTALLFAAPAAAQTAAPVTVWIQTTVGDIAVELDPEHAPVTVENFLRYASEGHYDGTAIYRVAPGFVIQMGSYLADGTAREVHDPIPSEADNGLSNLRGTLAMAREDAPDSATAEFFINLVDNTGLDAYPEFGRDGYAVFGRVVYGMEIVDMIEQVPLGNAGPYPDNAPATPITITRVVAVN